MEMIFLFDSIVDRILEGKIDDILISMIKRLRKKFLRETFCFNITDALFSLDLINLEAGTKQNEPDLDAFAEYRYGFIGYDEATTVPHFAMLYGKSNIGNIRRNILTHIEHYYRSDGTTNNLEMYHMIKNRFYEGVSAMLDRELIFEDMNSMSKMMGIAVRLKDIECLKLFIERGFDFLQEDKDYLVKKYNSYMNHQVIPLLNEYKMGMETEC